MLRDQVPHVPRMPWGVLALVFNVLPTWGFGTMLAAARADSTRHFGIGLAQFALAVVSMFLTQVQATLGAVLALLAWVWSILWGVLIVMGSK